MTNDVKIIDLSEEEKNAFIARLVDELPVLRLKLGISQDEMGNMLGISRQTYSSIETKRRKMSWPIYLSLILIFDYNDQTHDFIRQSGVFPKKLFPSQNYSREGQPLSSFVQLENDDIKNHLDEQAIHAIETVIMVEYARCNNLPGDAVVKAFDGKRLSQVSDEDIRATAALNRIKAGSDRKKL